MNAHQGEPKALFLSPDGNIYPDTLICSGILPAELNGKPCPYSQAGRILEPLPLNRDDPSYSIDKEQPGELCSPCAKLQLTNLGHWQGHGKQKFPQELLSLRLFKCRIGCGYGSSSQDSTMPNPPSLYPKIHRIRLT